jgi:hypothetical protein
VNAITTLERKFACSYFHARMKLKPSKHVNPTRIWSFIYHQFELKIEEQRHLNVCVYCADVFKLCVTADTVEQVLNELRNELRMDERGSFAA